MKISILISRVLIVFGLLTMVAVPSVNAGSEHSDDREDKKDKSDYEDDSKDDRDDECEEPLLGGGVTSSPHDHENDKDHEEEECEVDPVDPDLPVISPTVFALPATR